MMEKTIEIQLQEHGERIATAIEAERGSYNNALAMHNDYWYVALARAAEIARTAK